MIQTLIRRILTLTFCLISFWGSISALNKIYEIPFEFRNNFIVLDVVFNKSITLKFIYDTGAENTILTKKEISDILGMRYDRQFKIVGSDLETIMYAYLVRDVQLDISKFTAKNKQILVLEDDYIRFEEFIGINIHGIIGSDLFRSYVIKINYRRKLLTLYEPGVEVPGLKKYKAVPITIERNKPYYISNIELDNKRSIPLKLLIDTGASLYLLLHTNSHDELKLPERYIPGRIGMGLGGYLEGYIGRVHQMDLGPFLFNSVIANFQEFSKNSDSTLMVKNGILGNALLSRFTVIFDYAKGILYLNPSNRKYNKDFRFDKSGLVILATGTDLNDFIVNDIIPNSPAEEGGFEIGDIVKSVNWIPSTMMDLRYINAKFQKKPGKTIRFKIERDGKILRKKLVLRNLI